MPLEEDAANEELRRYLVKRLLFGFYIKGLSPRSILLQASDSISFSVLFRQTMEIIGRSIPFEEEPMINLLGWFDNCQWTVCLFSPPHAVPGNFMQRERKILFSPGCVDMAGLIISPREEDFRKYSAGL